MNIQRTSSEHPVDTNKSEKSEKSEKSGERESASPPPRKSEKKYKPETKTQAQQFLTDFNRIRGTGYKSTASFLANFEFWLTVYSLDEMVKAGIILGDYFLILPEVTRHGELDKENPRLEIYITDIGD